MPASNRVEAAARHPRARRRTGVAAVLAALILTPLAACERQASGDPSGAVAPAAAASPDLAGAPAPAPAAPLPSSLEAPSAAPAPYAPQQAPSAAPAGMVAMEPIPNPPEPPPRPRARRGRLLARAAAGLRWAAHRRAGPARSRTVEPHHSSARLHSPGPAPVRQIAAPADRAERRLAPERARSAAEYRPAPATPATAARSDADQNAKLAALQTALTGAVQKSATLEVPADATPDRPSDVTLTMPAAFADEVRQEAGRQGLSEAATSVNLSAQLTGDGYTALPEDAQTQPLLSGRPTRFHWTVIAQPGARGPLHADVKAQLLGGGADSLQLGTVMAADVAGHAWKVLGLALLVAIGLGLVAWLGVSRRGPRTIRTVQPAQPLDMTTRYD